MMSVNTAEDGTYERGWKCPGAEEKLCKEWAAVGDEKTTLNTIQE